MTPESSWIQRNHRKPAIFQNCGDPPAHCRVQNRPRNPSFLQPAGQVRHRVLGIRCFPDTMYGRDRFEPLQQLSIAKGSNVHADPNLPDEAVHLRQSVQLRAMRVAVVRDIQHPGCIVGRGMFERSPRCFEISEAESAVGFQMRSLRPLVPRVDEYQSFIVRWEAFLGIPDRVDQPSPVERRRRIDEYGACAAPPRGVVPPGIDCPNQRIRWWRIAFASIRKHRPVVDAAGKPRIQLNHLVFNAWWRRQIRWKLDSRIKSELRGIDGFE